MNILITGTPHLRGTIRSHVAINLNTHIKRQMRLYFV